MTEYRPIDRFARKWRKFCQQPASFFKDARNPVMRHAGLWVLGHLKQPPILRLDGDGVEYFTAHTEWIRQDNINEINGAALGTLTSPFVAIIGDLNLVQCKKYRILQKIEALNEIGVRADLSHWQDIPRSMELLQLATTVIFYRVQYKRQFLEYCREATRLRIPFGYDIDDPIFDRAIYQQNQNLKYLDSRERNHLLQSSELYSNALRACDFAIASTPGMQNLIGQHFEGPVYLWRNLIDKQTLHFADVAHAAPQASCSKWSKGVVLGYVSGSRAHEADFRVIEEPLAYVMARHREVRLLIVGHLVLPEKLRRFEDRIVMEPFTDYANYIARIASTDILVIPLVQDAFNECKSAIRYLEAASVDVPVIATAVGDFRNVVRNGENGILAGSPEQWVGALERLINSRELRTRMGQAAHSHVLATQTTQVAVSDELRAVFGGSADRE